MRHKMFIFEISDSLSGVTLLSAPLITASITTFTVAKAVNITLAVSQVKC